MQVRRERPHKQWILPAGAPWVGSSRVSIVVISGPQLVTGMQQQGAAAVCLAK